MLKIRYVTIIYDIAKCLRLKQTVTKSRTFIEGTNCNTYFIIER